MRFLLLNQFYPPDLAPTGAFLHDLARTLRARGHEVDVITSRASYGGGERYPSRHAMDGVSVRRVYASRFPRTGFVGRSVNYVCFYLAAAVASVRGPRPAAVVSLTTPPYLGLLVSLVASLRRAVDVHWVMDVYPDVLAAAGLISGRGPVVRILRGLASFQFRNTPLVIGLGPRMAERLQPYLGSSTKLECVPLWAKGPATDQAKSDLEGEARAMRSERGWRPGDTVLMYSGNMGEGHRFREFLAAAERLGPTGPIWAFCGGGKRLSEIAAFSRSHAAARIHLLPYVPPDRLTASLSSADVHLVSLASGWEGSIVPSKVQAAFWATRPVLFVGPRESDIGRWVEESGGGWVVNEGDVGDLLRAVEAARDPAERARRGAAGHAFAREHFDLRRNCARISDLLEGTVGKKR